jgi:multidrug efflux pump
MNISKPFILRPVATALIMLAVLIAGILSWRQLPVAALPQVDYPIIQVFTFNPGASPDVMTRTVTAPLERRLGQIPGLQQMSSSSAAGASIITLQFALVVDMGVAEQEVQAAINMASSLLPSDLPTPPIYRKVNPADAPILTLAVSSSTMALPDVYDLVDTRVAQKIAQVSGVGMVSLAGGQRPALRVQANPTALASLGFSLEQLRGAIVAANTNQPKGSFDGPFRSTMLDANDQIRTPEEYRNLIIAYRNGTPVRLADVANVVSASEDRFLAAWANQQPAVLINIQRQPGANVIDVADRVQALLPQLTATLPAAVQVHVLTDRTQSIRSSVRDVQLELVFAIGLVIAVTFVFLRTIPATIIPSLAVPLSLIGTFAVMYWLGFSVNNLTLMALTIATGFVVDDAIVMLENIARHREQGASPLEAALKGAKEIGFTLISLTLSLIAVLIPLLFMADVVGRLFYEFAVTLAVAILISLLVSLTLTPMLCARLLTKLPADHSAELVAKSPGAGQGLLAQYGRALQFVLRHPRMALWSLVATFGLTALLYVMVPKGFFPVQDSGVIQVVTEAPQDISFQAMAQRQQALAEVLLQHPDVRSLTSFIGVDGSNVSINAGRMLINLAPHRDRTGDIEQTIAQLQQSAQQVTGIVGWFQPVQELSIEDKISRTQYQFTLSSPDSALLSQWLPPLLDALKQQPALADVAHDLQEDALQAYLDIDRVAAARLGIQVSQISALLQSAYSQRQITTLFTQSNQYRVILEVDPTQAQGLKALDRLYINTAAGQTIPLSSVVKVAQRPARLLINHQGQFPSVTVSFNLAPGASLGEAVDAIMAAKAQIALPLSVELSLQGAAAAFAASLDNTLWLMLAAVVTMYIVLGVLYESVVHPLTILSTLPSATVGALLALLLFDQPLDLIAVIGIVLLIGLVKKNGIMMVDFALAAQRDEGLTPRQAIYEAAIMRFRPILMTTMAALFGAIPLLLASGAGAELRQPLGLVMVGGLLVSQVLTLFTTPVVYLWFDGLRQRWQPTSAEQGAAP